MGRTTVNEFTEVEQLGNNEAIITFIISDNIVTSEYYPDVDDKARTFEVKLKVTNNTKYNTRFHAINAYNASTIEEARSEAMLYLRLDPDTLDNEYPEITEFDAHSN